MSEISSHRTIHFEEQKFTQERLTTPLPMAPLVTFDLNLNNLQEYLNKVASIVNKNTLQIQTLSEDISQRISFPDGLNLLETISLSVPPELGGQKYRALSWKEGLTSVSANLETLSSKVSDHEKFKSKVKSDFKSLSEKLEKKLDKEKFQIEKEELDKKISEKLNKDVFQKKISSLEDMVRKVEDLLASKVNELEKKISDVKTETLWKINDCEKLLKIRVNEQFVWDALATLEARLKKEADLQAALKISKQQSLFEKLQNDLKRLEEDSKKSLVQLEKELPKKLDEEKFQMLIQESFQKKKDRGEKDTEKRIKNLEQAVGELKDKLNSYSSSDEISKLFASIEFIKSELNKKAERDAVVDLFNTLKNIKPQVIQSTPQEFTELWKFREKALENFKKIDEKFEKLAKAMDLSVIKRALASKADEEHTKEEFLSVGQRLIDLENGQSNIWKELEKLNILVKKLFQTLDELGSKSGLALISTKPLSSHTCLSCGRGDSAYIPTVPHVQGYDGRFYKADMNTFRPGMTGSDWRPEDMDNEYRSPITLNKVQKQGVNAILGKDLVKSLSGTGIASEKRFRPASAKK